MSIVKNSTYKQLKEKYETVFKRIEPYEKRIPLTTNTVKLNEYKVDIVDVHNNLIEFLVKSKEEDEFSELNLEIQGEAKKKQKQLLRALTILNLSYDFGNTLEIVDVTKIYKTKQSNSERTETASSSVEFQSNLKQTDDKPLNTDNLQQKLLQADDLNAKQIDTTLTDELTEQQKKQSELDETNGDFSRDLIEIEDLTAQNLANENEIGTVNLVENTENTSKSSSIKSSETNLNENLENTEANNQEANDNLELNRELIGDSNGGNGENPENNQNQRVENRTNTNMANDPMTIDKYMDMCSRHFKNNFNGNPSELSAFLATIKLLERFAVNDDLKAILNGEIYCKLTGNAATAVGPMPATYTELVEKLTQRIKFDSSKIVKAQIKAIRANPNDLHEYVRRIDPLLEKFKSALILEKQTEENANEYSIDLAIEICRDNSRLQSVRTVLSSNGFTTTRDVTAKFLTQTNIEEEGRTKQALHYNVRQQGRGRGHSQGNGQRNFQQNRNYQSNGNNFRNNNSYHNNNSRGQNRGYYNNFRGQNRNGYQGNQQNFNRNRNQGNGQIHVAEQSGPSQNDQQQNATARNNN